MSQSTVLSGPYRGFTLQEMRVEEARNKAARKVAFSDVNNASVDGQQFSFGTRRDGTLQEWTDAVYDALGYFDPDAYPRSAQRDHAVRFSSEF